MDESSSLKHWVMFGGAVLVIFVLYWAQAVFVPIALAALISFVLSPPTSWLERRVGRVPAVLAVVTLVFLVLGFASWALARQMNYLVDDLPQYRANIIKKIEDVRGAGKGSAVEKLQETLDDIKGELKEADASSKPERTPQPVVVTPEPPAFASFIPGMDWLGPLLGPLGTASLVLAFVIFMLLERRDLRDRLIGLIGHGRLSVTTKAFDEAGSRVSRQLLMQSLVNAIYGAIAGVGLYLLGVPYAFAWGALGAALRFVPYIGPVIAATAPILVALAALPGWIDPLWVIVFLLALEVFTNMVLETALYAGAAGVSQVALLVSIAFWTWLWGPLGLLMATPLTVCVVVLGKHVPGLSFIGTLMADTPALAPEYTFYQRLLARDPGEAADLIDKHVKTQLTGSVYDALLLPALNYAERDRMERRLSVEEEAVVIESTRELLTDAAQSIRNAQPAPAEPMIPAELPGPRTPLRVFAYAVNGPADELALTMLSQSLDDLPIEIEVVNARLLASELVSLVRSKGVSIVCLADLPPSPPTKTRYFVKRLHDAMPELRIIVGRWAPVALADENPQQLREAGATLVASTLADTQTYLAGLIEMPRVSAPKLAAVGQ
jgi:predicted PurR-regulated permease PerM